MVQLSVVQPDSSPEVLADFPTFWLLYPRHEAKKDAAKAWNHLPDTDRITAIEALAGWRYVWREKETQYIPLPASWLRGERYFDELPRQITTSTSAHIAFTPGESPIPKGELSDKIKALVAKLKGRP